MRPGLNGYFLASSRKGRRRRPAQAERLFDFDGKDGSLAGRGSHDDLMVEQFRQPPHDRQSQPQAAAALARRIVELVIFVEDRQQFLVRDADPGVPDFDADDSGPAPAAE